MEKGSYGEASFNRYKCDAKSRKLKFVLTKEEFKKFTKNNCYYCGVEPKQIYKRPKYKNYTGGLPYIYNGIDRVDNSKGYILSNCVSCCMRCNLMKKDISSVDFINACKAVINHQRSLVI